MKSFFKSFGLILLVAWALWGPSAWARDIIIITYGIQKDKALLVERLLKEEMKIPDRLIRRRRQRKPCQKSLDAILQICLKDDGEMSFPVAKKDVVTQSFNVFRN